MESQKTGVPSKVLNLLRYKRQYRRHPVKVSTRKGQKTIAPLPECAVIHGVPEYLQQVVRMRYGAKGKWGRGKYTSATKKGPGRRRVPLEQQNNPAGTKLVKRFIRDARGEQVAYRNTYAAMTGEHYHERYS